MSQQTQPQNDRGFQLPPPTQPQAPVEPGTTAVTVEVESSPIHLGVGVADTASRDLMIGAGILLLLMIGFFFARNAYANMLVGKRVAPGKANAAGWWLFILLTSLATGAILAVVNPIKFLAPLTLGPVGAIALLALILMLVSGRR